MPHIPMAVAATAAGPYCGWCGVLRPEFVCCTCWTRQGLFIPGAAPPPSLGPGAYRYVAPAVRAGADVGGRELQRMLNGAASEFVNEFAAQLGQDAWSAVAAWC